METYGITLNAPEEGVLRKAADLLAEGRVIAFPTETFYGLLARLDNAAALKRIQTLKGRSRLVPMPCIAGDAAQAGTAFDPPPAALDLLAERFWPGPLTLIGNARAEWIGPATGGGRTIGVRVSGAAAPRRLAGMCGALLAATSANPTGKPPAASGDDVRRYFGPIGDLALFDGGPLPPSRGSTIIDLTAEPPNLVRPGDLPVEDIERALGLRLQRIPVHEDEKLQELMQGPLRILQKTAGFRYAIDALLLASFVKFKPGEHILDIGSGTGVIPLILAARGATRVVGMELQPGLVDMSRRSIAVNRLEDRASVVHGDARRVQTLFGPETFDIVVSNPPYFPVGTGHLSPDDARAASRHELTMSLQELIAAACYLLKDGGRLCLIHLAARGKELLALLEKGGLPPCKAQHVYPKEGDEPKFILVCAVKGAPRSMDTPKPLTLQTSTGDYTEEVKRLIRV